MPASNQTVYAMQVRQIWGVYIPCEQNVKKNLAQFMIKEGQTHQISQSNTAKYISWTTI